MAKSYHSTVLLIAAPTIALRDRARLDFVGRWRRVSAPSVTGRHDSALHGRMDSAVGRCTPLPYSYVPARSRLVTSGSVPESLYLEAIFRKRIRGTRNHMTHSLAEQAATAISRGIGRRGFAQAVA